MMKAEGAVLIYNIQENLYKTYEQYKQEKMGGMEGAKHRYISVKQRNTQVDRCGHDERWGASEDKHRGRFRTVEWIQKRRTNRKTGREEPEGIRNWRDSDRGYWLWSVIKQFKCRAI